MLSSPPKQDSRLIDDDDRNLQNRQIIFCVVDFTLFLLQMADVCRDESEFAPVVRRCDGQQETLARVGRHS